MVTSPKNILIQLARCRCKLFLQPFPALLALFFIAVNQLDAGLFAQESPRIAPQLEAVRAIHDEFRQYGKKKELLDREFERIQFSIKETEDDLRKLQNEALRKQIQLIQLDWETACNSTISQLESENTESSQLRSSTDEKPGARHKTFENQLRSWNSMVSLMDQIVVQRDLQQIDAVSRLVIQRRLQAYRDGEKWFVAVRKWTQEQALFFHRYWRFTDPSRIHAKADCEVLLKTLDERSAENYPARLAASVLKMRLGRSDESIRELDQFILDKTPLQAPAFAARSLAYATRGTAKKADSDMVTAMKLDRDDPTVRYFHALLSAAGRKWSDVEDDAKILLKLGDHEVATRRLLAICYATRAAKSPKLWPKVHEQAKLLCAFQPEPVWHDRLLLSLALYGLGKTDEAAAAGTEAVEAAAYEQRAFAEKTLSSAKSAKPIVWSVLRP